MLEIIEGSEKGQKFSVRHGLKIGRKRSDITLSDKKVSSFHALIELASNKQWILTDQKSANGTFVKGEKITSIVLRDGLEVQFGNTVLRVSAQPVTKGVGIQDTDTSAGKTSTSIKPSVSQSREQLANWLLELANDPQNKPPVPPVVAPFSSIVKLQFIVGPQLNTTWEIGYGPRRVGSKVHEFNIWDPEAPAIAFYLRPDSAGMCVFSTPKPNVVLVNNQSVVEKRLTEGDEIRIRNMVLKVISCP